MQQILAALNKRDEFLGYLWSYYQKDPPSFSNIIISAFLACELSKRRHPIYLITYTFTVSLCLLLQHFKLTEDR